MSKPAGSEHPHPDLLLAFCERMARELPEPRGYIRRTAKMVETNYPGSAQRLLPRLRQIYRAAKK
jgi:hypothetical protein